MIFSHSVDCGKVEAGYVSKSICYSMGEAEIHNGNITTVDARVKKYFRTKYLGSAYYKYNKQEKQELSINLLTLLLLPFIPLGSFRLGLFIHHRIITRRNILQ